MKTLPEGINSGFNQDMPPDDSGLKQPTSISEALQFLGDREYFGALFDELAKFANDQIKKLHWFGGNKPEVGHVVSDALYAIAVDRVRSWNPEKHSFDTMCCLVISSKIKNEFEASQRFRSVSTDEIVESDVGGSGVTTSQVQEYDPAKAMISAEDWDEIMKLLPTENTEANGLLRKLVEAIAFSSPVREEPKPGNRPRQPGWSNLELAAHFSVSRDAIENAKKRLGPILRKWQFEQFMKTLPEDGRPWRAFVEVAMSSSPPNCWRKSFTQRWSLTEPQVLAMGIELSERIKTYRRGTWRNVDILANHAHRIERNNLISI